MIKGKRRLVGSPRGKNFLPGDVRLLVFGSTGPRCVAVCVTWRVLFRRSVWWPQYGNRSALSCVQGPGQNPASGGRKFFLLAWMHGRRDAVCVTSRVRFRRSVWCQRYGTPRALSCVQGPCQNPASGGRKFFLGCMGVAAQRSLRRQISLPPETPSTRCSVACVSPVSSQHGKPMLSRADPRRNFIFELVRFKINV